MPPSAGEAHQCERARNKTNLALSIEYNQHAQHADQAMGCVIWHIDKTTLHRIESTFVVFRSSFFILIMNVRTYYFFASR